MVILVNVFGWAWKPTVGLQRVFLLLTFLSWFAAGAVYGWGYCFLTDWHWSIKEARGITGLPDSFISYLLYPLYGAYAPREIADQLIVAALLVGIAGAVWRWRRERSRRLEAALEES